VNILNNHYNKAEFYSILFQNELKKAKYPREEQKQFKPEMFEEQWEVVKTVEVPMFVDFDKMLLNFVDFDFEKYKYIYENIEYSEIWYLMSIRQYHHLINLDVIKK